MSHPGVVIENRVGSTNPLTLPTSIRIMDLFSNGRRQTPKHVAIVLDMDPRYMSERLRSLKDRGYLRDVCRGDENSGMTVITELGVVVATHSETYTRDQHDVFEGLCQNVLDNQNEGKRDNRLSTCCLSKISYRCLEVCGEQPGLLIASNIAEEMEDQGMGSYSVEEVRAILYELYFYGLLERKENMPVYTVTDDGEIVISTGWDDHEIVVEWS